MGKASSYQELQPFFDYQGQLNDNLIRILINGIGIKDNMDAKIVTLSIKPGTPTAFSPGKSPVAIYVGKQEPITNPITSFVWEFTIDNKVQCTITTNPATTETLTVTLVVHYS